MKWARSAADHFLPLQRIRNRQAQKLEPQISNKTHCSNLLPLFLQNKKNKSHTVSERKWTVLNQPKTTMDHHHPYRLATNFRQTYWSRAVYRPFETSKRVLCKEHNSHPESTNFSKQQLNLARIYKKTNKKTTKPDQLFSVSCAFQCAYFQNWYLWVIIE